MGENNQEPLRISVEEAKERGAQEKTTFLDVVDPDAYEKIDYQIEDAVRIDPKEIKEEYDGLSKENTILAYCT